MISGTVHAEVLRTATMGILQEKQKTPGVNWTTGVLFESKSGDTYSRTFGTTIGSESLTTVFGMGTGVTFRI